MSHGDLTYINLTYITVANLVLESNLLILNFSFPCNFIIEALAQKCSVKKEFEKQLSYKTDSTRGVFM